MQLGLHSMMTKDKMTRMKQDAGSSGDDETYEAIDDIKPQRGFGITEECLNMHCRCLTKHEMRLGIHLNSRMPSDETSFTPGRKWRDLTFYLIDFVRFVSFEYVTRELHEMRVRAFSKRPAVLASLCGP